MTQRKQLSCRRTDVGRVFERYYAKERQDKEQGGNPANARFKLPQKGAPPFLSLRGWMIHRLLGNIKGRVLPNITTVPCLR